MTSYANVDKGKVINIAVFEDEPTFTPTMGVWVEAGVNAEKDGSYDVKTGLFTKAVPEVTEPEPEIDMLTLTEKEFQRLMLEALGYKVKK